MPQIASHILDIAENSVRAQASLIEIVVCIRPQDGTLTAVVRDDGCGMTPEQTIRASDPFFTTRATRKTGFGVPFIKQAAEDTGGSFQIASEPGKGTTVEAVFALEHIDRMPLGDISAVIHSLILSCESADIRYTYAYAEKSFTLDTRQMREILGGNLSFQEPAVSAFIRDYLRENKEETDGGAGI